MRKSGAEEIVDAMRGYKSPDNGYPYSSEGIVDLEQQLFAAARVGDSALLEQAALTIRRLRTSSEDGRGVRLTLVACKLREVGYRRYLFHRNLLGVAYSCIGTDRVGVIPVGGVLDKSNWNQPRGWVLEHLAGDAVAAIKWLNGDELVQLLQIDSYIPRTSPNDK